MKAIRDAFGDELMNLGEEMDNLYVVDCDISISCKTVEFQNKFPEKHLNVGIAEQNGAGISAGLATCGKVPFVSTYAVFGTMRMCEQIRQVICYPNLNVKIACSHGGLTPANDGASHQCIEDIGIMRTLPNMTVIAPGDYYSARKLIRAAASAYGPMYLRFTRDEVPFVYDENEDFQIGKAQLLREGSDVAIIANGDILSLAVQACEILGKKGISARLLDMHTVKPLDARAVLDAAESIGAIITVEDHNIFNGLGSAVCEIIAEFGKGKVSRMGVQDRFGESAPYMELLEMNRITAQNIAAEAVKLLK